MLGSQLPFPSHSDAGFYHSNDIRGLAKLWGWWPWRIHPPAVRPLGFIISFLIPTAICVPKSSYGVRTGAIEQRANGPIKIILCPNEASASEVGRSAGATTESLHPHIAAAPIMLLTPHPPCCPGPPTARGHLVPAFWVQHRLLGQTRHFAQISMHHSGIRPACGV